MSEEGGVKDATMKTLRKRRQTEEQRKKALVNNFQFASNPPSLKELPDQLEKLILDSYQSDAVLSPVIRICWPSKTLRAFTDFSSWIRIESIRIEAYDDSVHSELHKVLNDVIDAEISNFVTEWKKRHPPGSRLFPISMDKSCILIKTQL